VNAELQGENRSLTKQDAESQGMTTSASFAGMWVSCWGL